MASSVEQKLAASRERLAPIAAAPGGGSEGERDPRLKKMAAALQGRLAANREWKAECPAVSSAVSLAVKAFSSQGTRGNCRVALPLPLLIPSSGTRQPHFE
jgi:hypothetical protein